MFPKLNTYAPKVGEELYFRCRDWAWTEHHKIPIRIVAEYDRFYIVEVIPHRVMFGMSRPYSITLNKGSILGGDIELYA